GGCIPVTVQGQHGCHDCRGNGRFEMACRHLGSQSQRRRHHYQKVQGSLSVGDVMIIHAGHPITVLATGDSDLRMVGIGFNAHNNRMNFLAGRQSIWRNVDREAKEVSFNMPAREVEEILQKQDQSYFVAGQEQRQQQMREERTRGRQYGSSSLDFVF
ncbi:vicilin gc72-a, partial [Nicotiana attenuata]